mmetsp:Transcript_39101/g.93429  ORF Transcript_39101/g.93429 Transcript_39101/m.93429 type:complete len:208 (+) Transcript_39101:1211-1834(+)
MLPNAQTACSRTSSFGDCKSCTKIGSAPCSTTTRVWSAFPEAMLVSTHAASNCRSGRLISFRNWTKRGTTPALITSEMGGFCSILSSFRNCWVALNCAWGSSDSNAWLRAGICSTAQLLGTVAIRSPICAKAIGSVVWPAAGMSLTILFFISASSLVCLRSWTAASSRFRRASSASTPFLKAFCRWLSLSPKPDMVAGMTKNSGKNA